MFQAGLASCGDRYRLRMERRSLLSLRRDQGLVTPVYERVLPRRRAVWHPNAIRCLRPPGGNRPGGDPMHAAQHGRVMSRWAVGWAGCVCLAASCTSEPPPDDQGMVPLGGGTRAAPQGGSANAASDASPVIKICGGRQCSTGAPGFPVRDEVPEPVPDEACCTDADQCGYFVATAGAARCEAAHQTGVPDDRCPRRTSPFGLAAQGCCRDEDQTCGFVDPWFGCWLPPDGYYLVASGSSQGGSPISCAGPALTCTPIPPLASRCETCLRQLCCQAWVKCASDTACTAAVACLDACASAGAPDGSATGLGAAPCRASCAPALGAVALCLVPTGDAATGVCSADCAP
jgi:hypothetical protein